jgi:hypothetical protein
MKTKKTKRRDVGDRGYQSFKGYYTVSYDQMVRMDEPHFVVPWELDHKDDEKLKLAF